MDALFPTSTNAGVAGSLPAVKVLNGGSLVSVVAAVAVLLLIGAGSVWQAGRNADALDVAQATRVLRNNATDLLVAATAAETSQRGYLLTLDPDYLQPLVQAEADLPQLVAAARARWPGDVRVEPLARSVTAKLSELRQTANLAAAGQLSGALAIVKTNAGFVNMAVIRRLTTELASEQDARLIDQVARVTTGSRILVGIDIAGLLVVFALAGLIALGLRAYLGTLRSAQAQTVAALDQLERTNDGLDETVRHRTAALTAANGEIQRFAYIVSHDLRAPLVNIMGFTSELEQATATLSRHALATDPPPDLREALQEEIPEALRFIKSSTAKMDRLINAILKLSREGSRVLAAERLEMAALLGGVLETMRHQAESAGAQVVLGAVPDLVADRLAVEQVFGNVVENALKYLQPARPGAVRVQGQLEGRMAHFTVSDNGRGIAARDYERVFELFRRAGDQSVQGEGIGLAHVRALVRRLGGSIDCTSEVGIGTVFHIRLPVTGTYEREIPV